MFNYFFRIFCQRKNLILLSLGFSSGLPFALTSSTLQAWMTVENIDLKTIGFFSLVGQAYVFKFLWSPMMDCYAFFPFLGKRRSWLLLSQILLIIGTLAISFIQPSKNLMLLAILAILMAFFSASQDIIFDAWKTDVLLPEERGNGAAISVLGYRLAMLVSGGLALWLADRYLGWPSTYRLIAILMIPGVLTTLYTKDPSNSNTVFKPQTLEQSIIIPLRDFFNRNHAWLILSLIVLYKLGDAFAASLATSFLIRGVGFDAGEVGFVNKTLGLLAVITGTLYGGVIVQRLTFFKALMLFGILQAISNLSYCILSFTDKQIYSMALAIFIENLSGSMGTASFVALMMTLCNKSFSATQFALLSSLSAVGRVYIGLASGWVVEIWGWSKFYAFSVVATLPGLMLLVVCKKTIEHAENTNNFIPRTKYEKGYKWAIRILISGCIFLFFSFIILGISILTTFNIKIFLIFIFTIGIALSLFGIIIGSVLDYLAIKQSY